MLINGDKLMVTKSVSNILNEGDIIKVLNIGQDGIITFAFGDDFIHMGITTIDEVKKHFKRIELKEISFDETIDEYEDEDEYDDEDCCGECYGDDCEFRVNCIYSKDYNPTHTDKLLNHILTNLKIYYH